MSGRWLVRPAPEPKHLCDCPKEAEAGAVWECGCRRVYRYSDGAGYGFEWRRVLLRSWWFRLRAALTREGT